MLEEVEVLYRQVYSEPPEYQDWDDTLGDYLWHYRDNIITCDRGGNLVGVAIAIPLSRSLVARELISTPDGETPMSLWFPENSWYLADLIVHKKHRRQGIGSRLLRLALYESPNTPWVLRVSTSRTGAIALYEKTGFEKVPVSQIVYYSSIRARKQFMVKNPDNGTGSIDVTE